MVILYPNDWRHLGGKMGLLDGIICALVGTDVVTVVSGWNDDR